MAQKIRLETLGEDFLFPDNFVLHNERYTSFINFIDSVYKNRFGRPTTLRELSGYSLANFHGAYSDYEKDENGLLVKHAHIFVAEDIKPYSLFALYCNGHEETHVLLCNSISGEDSLKRRLDGLSLDSSLFSGNEEFKACVGGLSCLAAKGISVSNDSDLNWKDFVSQGKLFDIFDSEGFPEAIDWFVKNKRK